MSQLAIDFPRTWSAEEAAATVGDEWDAMKPPEGCERGFAWMAWRDGLQRAVRDGLVEMRSMQGGTKTDGWAYSQWRRIT